MQNTEIIIYLHDLQLNSERRRKKRRAHVTEICHKRVCEKERYAAQQNQRMSCGNGVRHAFCSVQASGQRASQDRFFAFRS